MTDPKWNPQKGRLKRAMSCPIMRFHVPDPIPVLLATLSMASWAYEREPPEDCLTMMGQDNGNSTGTEAGKINENRGHVWAISIYIYIYMHIHFVVTSLQVLSSNPNNVFWWCQTRVPLQVHRSIYLCHKEMFGVGPREWRGGFGLFGEGARQGLSLVTTNSSDQNKTTALNHFNELSFST